MESLPVELWTEIVLLASPFVNIPPDPATHLSILRKPTYSPGKARAAQAFRLGLLHVSRKFYRLAEPFLYKEVTLSGKRQVQRLRKIAKTKKFKSSPRLELTKSLFIYPGAISTFTSSAPVHDLFPNLITMVAYEANQRLFWMWDIKDGYPSLTHTTIYPIDISCFINKPPAGFRSASIGHFIREGSLPLVATNLSAVSMNPKALHVFKGLELPSLKHLFVEVYTRESIYTFIKKNGSNLVELEYSVSPLPDSHNAFPTCIFEVCRKLKLLRFDPSTVGPIGDVGFPHYSLSELVMPLTFVNSKPYLDHYLPRHLKNFTHIKFPNLSLVTIQLEICDNLDQIHNSISVLFPDVNISVINS